jgi:hypothetical protein
MRGALIEVSAIYQVPLEVLWEELRHIDRHVKWMADAESIEFVSDQRSGVGTSFRCRTRVGPLVTLDVLTITDWVENSRMGVEHRGIVRGSGTFVLDATSATQCRLVWSERLQFPWWGLGAFGAFVARPVLRRLWRGNLRRLGNQLTTTPQS